MEKYCMQTGMHHPIHHIHLALQQEISIFSILFKMLWMTKTFL